MTNPPAGQFGAVQAAERHRAKDARKRVLFLTLFLAGAAFLAQMAYAQASPQITGIDPSSGKVNDTVTAAGTALGKDSVAAVYLSDDTMDYKAMMVDQADDKIVFKVPEVKPGNYNVSIQVGTKIFIKPVHFTVQ